MAREFDSGECLFRAIAAILIGRYWSLFHFARACSYPRYHDATPLVLQHQNASSDEGADE